MRSKAKPAAGLEARGTNKMVGLPGIEPGLYAPEAHVLPVYYSP